jgi:Domain of unknown function (DUF4126)
MLELLTGTGLATAAGLNAYIPMLTLGVLARYTDLITLPSSWQWLENGWVLGILGVLLALEVVADKVPVVDHINDVVQTVVRPTAGGLTFGAASSSETVTVSNPDVFFSDNNWVPIVVGAIIALVVHAAKATARPVVNGATMGVGAPVVSTVEDGFSLGMSVIAIVLPILVLVFLIGMFALFWTAWRRRSMRKALSAP